MRRKYYMTEDFYNEIKMQVNSYKTNYDLMEELSEQINEAWRDEATKDEERLNVLETFGAVL